MSPLDLLQSALAARLQAYAPYSGFAVGAALETPEGKVYAGCNVENLSFGLTVCAERAALFSAIAAGERRFVRVAIVADSREPIAPCGACRQVLAEFAPDLEVCGFNLEGAQHRDSLAELLPRARAGILDKPCST